MQPDEAASAAEGGLTSQEDPSAADDPSTEEDYDEGHSGRGGGCLGLGLLEVLSEKLHMNQEAEAAHQLQERRSRRRQQSIMSGGGLKPDAGVSLNVGALLLGQIHWHPFSTERWTK